ncbi:AAA family ATPase [Candidatus Woesearchaeota archaeon]|nr:AAA family ATPase [Candidatus Woesearchaeota archaeon]
MATQKHELIAVPSILERLSPYAAYMKDYQTFEEKKIPVPRGVLFSGPRGTGKSTAAYYLANLVGAETVSIYDKHEKDKKWTKNDIDVIFNQVCADIKQKKKSKILLVEDFETLGKNRANLPMEEAEVVTEFTLRLDGVHGEFPYGLLVIGITTSPGQIDPAFLRAGRFDETIEFGYPNLTGRTAVMNHYLHRYAPDHEIPVDSLAALMKEETTAADIEGIIRNSIFRAAARNPAQPVPTAHDAIELIIADHLGSAKPLSLTPEERLKIAVHEAGHAIVGMVLDIPVQLVCVRASGYTRGATIPISVSNIALTYQDLRNKIAFCYGGKVADELVHDNGSYPLGHASDLTEATLTAQRLVDELGFSQKFSNISFLALRQYRHGPSTPALSQHCIEESEPELHRILWQEYGRTQDILKKVKKERVMAVAELIVSKEYVVRGELRSRLEELKILPWENKNEG